jgi:hypothetical protein
MFSVFEVVGPPEVSRILYAFLVSQILIIYPVKRNPLRVTILKTFDDLWTTRPMVYSCVMSKIIRLISSSVDTNILV